MVVVEASGVEKIGRISPGDVGLYKEEHIAAHKRIVDFVHKNSYAKIGIQLAHAGRKASTEVPFSDHVSTFTQKKKKNFIFTEFKNPEKKKARKASQL